MAFITISPSEPAILTTVTSWLAPYAAAAVCSLMNQACSGILTMKPILSGASAAARPLATMLPMSVEKAPAMPSLPNCRLVMCIVLSRASRVFRPGTNEARS